MGAWKRTSPFSRRAGFTMTGVSSHALSEGANCYNIMQSAVVSCPTTGCRFALLLSLIVCPLQHCTTVLLLCPAASVTATCAVRYSSSTVCIILRFIAFLAFTPQSDMEKPHANVEVYQTSSDTQVWRRLSVSIWHLVGISGATQKACGTTQNLRTFLVLTSSLVLRIPASRQRRGGIRTAHRPRQEHALFCSTHATRPYQIRALNSTVVNHGVVSGGRRYVYLPSHRVDI